MSVMGAIEQDFSAYTCVWNVSEINLHLVHADAPDYRCSASFNQHLSAAGKLPGKTIVIAKRHNADFGAALCGKSPVVAQSIARRKFLNAGDAARDAARPVKIHHYARCLRRINFLQTP